MRLGYPGKNIWYILTFYRIYCKDEKLQPLVGEISWAKHLIIMGRCKDLLEREFYIRMTKRMGWTKNVLVHQIDRAKSFASQCKERHSNITIKKIPQMVLGKCEFGQDNYDLNIIKAPDSDGYAEEKA